MSGGEWYQWLGGEERVSGREWYHWLWNGEEGREWYHWWWSGEEGVSVEACYHW